MFRVLLLLIALLVPAFGQDVRISEFLPVNTLGIEDEDLTRQPWIEIWNTNATTKATLTNCKLVHGATQWTFPIGMEIPPGDFLVVFASGKNRSSATAPLHTNFTLSASGGGPLQLIRSDATTVTSFASYPALAANVSYGRDAADDALVGSYTNPSPGNPNNYSGPGVAGKVAFSVPSRAFSTAFTVTLSEATPAAGAVIRYTLNGTAPTSASTQYTTGSPIPISNTTQLRARVFEPGKLPGETDVAGYLLLNDSTSTFETAAPIAVVSNFNAPLSFTADAATDVLTTSNVFAATGHTIVSGTRIKLYTTGTLPAGLGTSTEYYARDVVGTTLKLATISGGTAVNFTDAGTGTHTLTVLFPDTGDQAGFMWIWEPGIDGRSRFTNSPTLATRVAVDRRGSSTLGNLKTNFNLEARKGRDDDDRDINLLGMGDGADWVFHAPYQYDRSLIHNPLMYALSNSIGRAAMLTKTAEVFVETSGGALNYSGGTSGDYYGVYNVMQKIRRAADRVDVQKLEPYDNDAVAKTGGYIVKVDRQDSGDSGFNINVNGTNLNLAYYYPKEVEVKSPTRDLQEQYLTGFFNSFVTALYGVNYRDATLGYAPFLDVGAAIDHHLLNTWGFNVDGLRLSGYMSKDRSGKLVYGPVWDFDRALSSTDGRDSNPLTWRSQSGDFGTDFFNFSWWARLFSDPDFYQKYIDRWVELRRGKFSAASVNALIDSLNAELTAEGVARDLSRWAQSKRSWTSPINSVVYSASQAAEIQRLKDYLLQRANFFDTQWVAPVTLSVDTGSVLAGSTVTMNAGAGSTIYYTLDGSDPRPVGGDAPSGGNVLTYSERITINANTRIKVRAYNPNWTALTGANNPPLVSKWSGLRDVRLAVSPAATAGTIAVSEVNYHPTDPTARELALDATFKDGDFEFVELKNVSAGPVDLNGVQLTTAGTFTFTNDNAITLQPGQYAVIAANPSAIAARYGSVANVVGPFAGDLANSAEQIVVRSAAGVVLADFTYVDDWHPSTDGGGRTLEALTTNAAQLNTAAGWRASIRIPGTPGFEDIAPVITGQPDDVTVNPGQPIVLSVTATGMPAPSFQWRKAGDPIGNATSSTYTIPLAAQGDEGSYDVVVTNFSNSVTSDAVTVSVNDPVVFTQHPGAQTVNPGTVVTFTAAATGTGPFSYQWRKGGTPMVGEEGPSLVLTAAESNQASYDVIITNIVGPVTSSPALLSVNDPVVFQLPPETQVVDPGDVVTFTATATGTGSFSYQWRKNTEPIQGATNAELSFVASEASEGSYDVVITNIVGPVTSAAASLSVNDPVMITAHPQPQTVNPGITATFSVSVSGTGPFDYQWRKGGEPIGGASGSQFTIPTPADGDEGSYDVVVRNSAGSATSDAASLSVNDPVMIVTHPRPYAIRPARAATFSVVADGTGPFTYQWRHKQLPIAGEQSATFRIDAASEADLGSYDVVVTNVVGSVTSEPAELSFVDWTVAAGTYQGVLIHPDLEEPETDEFPGRVTLAVNKTGKLSGKVDYRGLTHGFKAELNADLSADILVERRDELSMTLAIRFDAALQKIQVDVSHPEGVGIELVSATAPQIPKRTKSLPSARAGFYTALLNPGSGAPEQLNGSGYLLIKVNPVGLASWKGQLPDGASISGSAYLNESDEFAFHSRLYSSRRPYVGHVAGRVTMDDPLVNGDLFWKKPPQLKGDYLPGGFATSVSLDGRKWAIPPKGIPPIPAGSMTFEIPNQVTFDLESYLASYAASGVFNVALPNPLGLKLTLSRATGKVTGKLLDTFTGKARPFQGVMLQGENRGAGYMQTSGTIRGWELLPVIP